MTSQAQSSQKGIPSMPDYLENLFWSEGMRQRIIDVVNDSVEVEEKIKKICKQEVEYYTLKATVKNWRYWIPIIVTAVLAIVGIVV